MRSPVFLTLAGICRKIPMLQRTVQTQLPTILSAGPSKDEIPVGLSAVSGTSNRTPMCERLVSTLWSTTCASGLPKGADHLRLAKLQVSNKAVAEAQKEWDDLGHNRLQQLLHSDDRIVFPATESPIVSIILVFYNKAHLSLLCLDSILENADVSYEVVIVNNCSSDETNSLLERVDGATIINNTANLGFGDACTQGAEQARGEYLCFLNNDALLQPHALSSALASFGEDPKVGVVGGKILLANGDLQEAGSMIWSDGSALGYGRGDDPNLPQYEFRRPVDYCSGAFLVTTRSLFRQLGGFNRMFSPAYYEDADYCMQVWEAGYSVLYEPTAVIRHYESASSDGNEAAKPAMAINQQKFREKWNDQLLKHLPNSTANIQRARISASSDALTDTVHRGPNTPSPLGFGLSSQQ